MKYCLENEYLKIMIDSFGAELQSIVKNNQEYLWVADEQYWEEHSPILFPFVGRMTDGKLYLDGKQYSQEIHGFARRFSYKIKEKKENSITFVLQENDQTLAMYPYYFTLQISYYLKGNEIEVKYQVENRSQNTMHFGIGAHPGFNLPLEDGLRFEDYYLEFKERCNPDQIGMTDTCFLNGINLRYDLQDGIRLQLKHGLFDHDAIVLQNMARCVTLKAHGGTRSVTLSYPDMPYLGIWHNPKTEAPFVAVEPWGALPARQDIVEEFSCRSDFIHLKPGRIYTNRWSITIM